MLLFVREVEVVALISQRYRNHEIATRLCLSDRTGENHVHRILAKVGARSRTTLAEWAYDARLSPSDEPNQHIGQFEAIAGGLSAASSQAPSHVVEYSRLTDRRGPALAQFAPRWLRNGSPASIVYQQCSASTTRRKQNLHSITCIHREAPSVWRAAPCSGCGDSTGAVD